MTGKQTLPDWAAPPSLDDFAAMAERALAEIPQALLQHTDGVMIRVDEFPNAETERAMGLESPFDLLGLYHGIDIGHKTTGLTPDNVDMIFLYRRPILDYWCETGEDLNGLVRHVLIHEIGHHFGLSDEDMERIEEEGDSED